MIAIVVGIVLVGVSLAVMIRPSALPASQTKVIVYEPFTTNGIALGITVTSRVAGSCWEGSIASNRPDAWRCTVQNIIYDPCFSDPYGFNEVACPTAAFPNQVVIINLTRPLPYSTQNSSTNTQGVLTPWAYQITNGSHCGVSTGTTIAIAGLAVWGSCANGDQLIGTVNRNTHLWTVLMKSPDASSLTRVGIEKVWE